MYGEMEEEYVPSEFRCLGGKEILVLELSWVGSAYGIFDNLGRLIEQGFITEKTKNFDFSGQPRGMYTIQLSNQDEMKVGKVIIQ